LHIQRYRALSAGNMLEVSNAEHRAIVDALAERDPAKVFAAARAHILNGITRTSRARRRPTAAKTLPARRLPRTR
jgi:DNA-binding FadR family transcriptional regulator